MESRPAQVVNHAAAKRGLRLSSCLLWAMVIVVCLSVVGVIAMGGAYVGWNTGVATAAANASGSAEAELQLQCDLIPQDLAAGNLKLAQTRFESLGAQTPAASCLLAYAPTATALTLRSLPSPTAPPTMTAMIATTAAPTALPPTADATATPANDSALEYDLDALLEEARADLSSQDYPRAIDTLDAIIAIDGDFQREIVRRLYLDALKAQALLLYRTGRLSEAIVLTERAEAFGDIESLSYERFIALLYLDGQRLKVSNPAEAVRSFYRIVYEQNNPNYMNGQVLTGLQEAMANYADALALQGDHCPALQQYEAALNLQPARAQVNLAALSARKDQAALACGDIQLTLVPSSEANLADTPAGIGERAADPTLAPVGQSG